MSIDITCYTTLELNLLNDKVELIRLKHNNEIGKSYIIYEPHPVLTRQQLDLIEDRIEKYQKETKLLIAEEFGLSNAKSYLYIAVNDKSFSWLNTSEFAELLRRELGDNNIIVLLNGEELI